MTQSKTSDKTINEIENEIIEEFSIFDDWMDKYELIIDMGKSLAPIDNKYKNENYRVHGCQSNVWLTANIDSNACIIFNADSDAIITKGLIAMLIRVLSGQKSEDIINTKLSFIEKIGMKEHLTPTRANGLVAMIAKMKDYASSLSKN